MSDLSSCKYFNIFSFTPTPGDARSSGGRSVSVRRVCRHNYYFITITNIIINTISLLIKIIIVIVFIINNFTSSAILINKATIIILPLQYFLAVVMQEHLGSDQLPIRKSMSHPAGSQNNNGNNNNHLNS